MVPSADWYSRSWWKSLYQASIVVMVAVEVVSLAEMSLGRIWIGNWLWVSPSSFALVFLGTSVLVRRRGLGPMDTFLVSLTTMISMIWMYEIFYHFGYYADWSLVQPPVALANYNEPVVIDLMLTAVGLVGMRYMRAWPWFVLCFSAFLVSFVLWVSMGYPQVTYPGNLYPFGAIFIHVSDPAAWAWPLNALTKYLLALTYVSLFVGEPIAPSG